MRFALLTPVLAAGALFACTTFSSSEDEPTPPPAADGGVETGPEPGACTPVVFDPNAPSACAGKNLTNDPENCGACGHECVDTECVDGQCAREQLTGAQPILAIIGTKAYVPSGSKIQRADLTQRPLPVTFETYFDNQTGTVNHLEVHDGEIYIGWDNNQTILELTEPDPTPRPNAGFAAVKTPVFGGHYLPGATSYYLFPDTTAGMNLARIGPDLAVAYKKENGFLPIARSGDAIYWTQKLAGSANIFGPWERVDEPIARVEPAIEAFGAEGDTVFVVGSDSLSRASRGANAVAALAKEPGVGIAFAIDGDQLFYAVRRTVEAQERHYLFRIDKCRGGEPVPLMDINVAITGFYLTEPGHVMVNTTSGLFRTRR